MKVRQAMLSSPVTLPADATLRHVAETMDRSAVGTIVIVEAGRPVGIVTDRDLVVRGLARGVASDARVDSLMSLGVICVDADAELRDVVDILATHAFRRVPVVDHHQVVGMIALDDLLVRLVQDLSDATRGVTAQLLFRHPEPRPSVPSL